MRASLRQLAALLGLELRLLAREPLILAVMILMPLVGVPLAGVLGEQAIAHNRAQQRQSPLPVAAPPAFAAHLEEDDGLEVVDGILRADDPTPEVLAVVRIPEDPEQPARVRYTTRGRGQRAKRKVMQVMRRWQAAEQAERWHALGAPVAPDDLTRVEPVDQASEAQAGAFAAGGLLPALLIFLVFLNGLYVAFDAISGERERGTLETLLTAAPPRGVVLAAKFLHLWFVILGTLALYGVAFAGTLALREQSFQGFALPGGGALALAALIALPLLTLLAALLALSAAFVPDFRTGQAVSLPLMLAVQAPASVSILPFVTLSPALALVPIAGPCVAMRDALVGELSAGMAALVIAATGVQAAALLWGGARLLGREAVLLGGVPARARHARGRWWPEALITFAVLATGMWFLGSAAQGIDPIGGMVFTQLGVMAGVAVAAAWWSGRPMRELLSLRAPSAADAALGVLLGLSLWGVGSLVDRLQQPLLPTPSAFYSRMAEALTPDAPLAVLVLCFAVLPGICEELAFRGAIQGFLRGSLGPVARALAVGAMFGLIHMALPRILTTGALGVLLSLSLARSRSIAVPMIAHGLNNGLLIVLLSDGAPDRAEGSLAWAVAATGVAIAAVAGMGRATPSPGTPSRPGSPGSAPPGAS